MKISVVMATYNGERYLVEQLDSIRMQTLQPDEVILCDDCSKDNTKEIAEKFIKNYNLQDKWKVIVNQENLGYANNFNKVAELATGDLIFFADQDDLWVPQKIQKMANIMNENSKCQLLCSEYGPFSNGKDSPQIPRKVLRQIKNDGTIECVKITPQSIYLRTLGCCMCVKRSFYQEVREYWFDGWAQDDRMWRLAQCVDGCYLLHFNLVRHRLHDKNTSTYGKYHTIEKRVKLFKNMQAANRQMLKILQTENGKNKAVDVIQKHIRMMDLRISLLENSKIKNVLLLIAYLPYYQSVKSLLLELYLIIGK